MSQMADSAQKGTKGHNHQQCEPANEISHSDPSARQSDADALHPWLGGSLSPSSW